MILKKKNPDIFAGLFENFVYYRLENCGRFLALCKPTFLRST